MKKMILTLLTFTLVLSLCACGTSAAKPAATPSATEAPQTEAPVGMANPVKPCKDAAEQLALTNLSLAAPEGSENVSLTAIVAKGTTPIAQLDFTLNGKEYSYRARLTGATELTDTDAFAGLYYEWTNSGEAKVNYCTANYHCSKEGPAYISWLDVVPGVEYCLSSNTATADELVSTANLVFVPTQGDAG